MPPLVPNPGVANAMAKSSSDLYDYILHVYIYIYIYMQPTAAL